MDYYKLLEDYLNETGNSHKDYEVLNWENRGTNVEVYYKCDNGTFSNERLIPLFDLISFVYGKI